MAEERGSPAAGADPAAVARHLSQAWQQLAGTELEFLPEPPHALNGDASLDLFALTRLFVPGTQTSAGVALCMGADAATLLASSMFGETPDAVDAGQRGDVCAELCNIFCSCVAPMFGDANAVELGLTTQLEQGEFRNTVDQNDIRCLYRAGQGSDCVSLVVINRFTPATSPAPQAPAAEPVSLPTHEEKMRMKFLIVDDSKAVQTIVRRAVEKTGLPGLEFRTASNGIEALLATDSWLPDMVITDWHMPEMSGIELIKALKQKFNRMLVGFVTTESAGKNLDEAKQHGAAFVLKKPFTPDELVRAVMDTLQKNGVKLPEGTPATAATAAAPEPAPAAAPAAEAGANVEEAPALRSADPNALVEFLTKALNLSVAVVPSGTVALESVQAPWAIGLYAQAGKNDVRGFCMLDRPAILLLGGPRAGMSNDALARAIAAGEVAQPVFDKAAELLNRGANVLFSSADGGQLALARSQLVQHAPEKLIEIMKKSRVRTDFMITHSGLPVGRITLMSR